MLPFTEPSSHLLAGFHLKKLTDVFLISLPDNNGVRLFAFAMRFLTWFLYLVFSFLNRNTKLLHPYVEFLVTFLPFFVHAGDITEFCVFFYGQILTPHLTEETFHLLCLTQHGSGQPPDDPLSGEAIALAEKELNAE